MKKSTLFAYAVVPVLGLGLLGTAGVASAQGFGMGMPHSATPEDVVARHQEMFQKQATLFGLGVEDVKAAWATGKSVQALAKDKGISEETVKAKLAAERKAQLQAQLQTLVSKGVITQAQADSRLKFMESFPKGGKGGKGGRGMHRGFGF